MYDILPYELTDSGAHMLAAAIVKQAAKDYYQNCITNILTTENGGKKHRKTVYIPREDGSYTKKAGGRSCHITQIRYEDEISRIEGKREKLMHECEKFFNSGWYTMMCREDPDYFMETIKKKRRNFEPLFIPMYGYDEED